VPEAYNGLPHPHLVEKKYVVPQAYPQSELNTVEKRGVIPELYRHLPHGLVEGEKKLGVRWTEGG